MSSVQTNFRVVKRNVTFQGDKVCIERYMGNRSGSSLYGQRLPEWETVYSVRTTEFPEFYKEVMSFAIQQGRVIA